MAIERNRKPLLRIVATLFAAIRFREGSTVERLPWALYRMVLSILYPAEAAVRRLIIVAAQGLVVKPSPERKARTAKAKPSGTAKGKGTGKSRILFKLFDSEKRFAHLYRLPPRRPPPENLKAPARLPRFFDYDQWGRLMVVPVPLSIDPNSAGLVDLTPKPPPEPKDPTTVNAKPLCRRLFAIKAALEDIPAQAKRYARWRAKPMEERRPKRSSALRPGPPPGSRKRPSHEVHEILRDCHWLACTVPQVPQVPQPNTS